MAKWIITILVLACITSLTGCFSANPEDIQYFQKPQESHASSEEYLIEPPDQVTVLASRVPELKSSGSYSRTETQTVRPDGIISFENYGEIMVAGKTPSEVAELLAKRMSELYKLSDTYPVDVRVENRSKYYYVIGEVRYEGAKIYTGRETTLSAISKAVITPLAWEEVIQVIRPSKDPSQPVSKIFQLNLKQMIEHGKMEQNVLLEEGDVIYVPPTILASIGKTVQELLGPVTGSATIVTAFSGI